MVFTIDNREYKDYQLSNAQIRDLIEKGELTPEQKECLNNIIFERFKYNLCPQYGESNDEVFARFFSNFVNGKLTSKKVVARKMATEHRYLQQEMFKVCMAYIEELSHCYDNGRFDPRNQWACETSKKVMDFIKENNIPY